MPNTLAGYQDAQDSAYSLQDRFRKDIARKQAGTALSGGNFDAASNSLFDAGMLSEGIGLQDKSIARQDAETARGYETEDRKTEADQRQKKEADTKRKEGLAFMVDATEMLQKVAAKGGPEEMLKAFDSLVPVFSQMTAPETIAQYRHAIAANPAVLQAIGKEAADKLKVFNTSSGVVGVDMNALGKDFNDPKAVRTLYQDPLLPAKQDATEALAEQRRRPPRGPASSAGVTGLPSGFVLR